MTINGKTYKPVDLDFNAICDLEDLGISLQDIQNKNLSLIRAFLMMSGNMTKEEAGAEIQAHLASGGNFESLAEPLGKAFEESGFFQALKASEDAKTQPVTKTSRKTTSEAQVSSEVQATESMFGATEV